MEYVASAIVDMEFHALTEIGDIDPLAFERDVLAKLGMPEEIVMRHRTPHFTHVFSGDGYSAGYYSYLWSEVLDADGFAAFEESGDVFDPALAKRLHDFVYSAGARQDPEKPIGRSAAAIPTSMPCCASAASSARSRMRAARSGRASSRQVDTGWRKKMMLNKLSIRSDAISSEF